MTGGPPAHDPRRIHPRRDLSAVMPHVAAELGPLAAQHVLAVSVAVNAMNDNLERSDALRVALLTVGYSPYHFHRIFRIVTCTTPGRFLAAQRMQAAKADLALTDRPVAQVCRAVGYRSISTFTSQFARLVGIPPGRFRRLVDAASGQGVPADPAPCHATAMERTPPLIELTLAPARPVAAQTQDNLVAVVGLFASDIPQGMPTSCVTLSDRLIGHLEVAPPAGRHHLFAVAFPADTTLVDLALDRMPGSTVAHRRITIHRDGPSDVVLDLRGRRHVDPPIVSSAAALRLLTVRALCR